MSKRPAAGPGLALALAAPVAFTFFNAGVRLVAGEMSVLGLLLARGFMGLLLAGAVSLFLRARPWSKNKKSLSLIGFAGVLSSVCSTAGFTLIPLYQAVVVLYLYPAMTVLLSAAITKEKITPGGLLGVMLSFGGCLVMVWPDGSSQGPSLQIGHLFSFMGGLLYALTFVLARRLGAENRGLEPLFFFSVFAVLGAVPLSLLSGVPLGLDGAAEVFHAGLLGLVGALAKLLVFAALRYLPPHKVGVVGTLEILGGALFSLLFFGDAFGVRSVIGGLMIIYAVFGFHRPPANDREEKSAPGIEK
ncbi:MAG: DMT family transporter [Deltaproteobacteria bacterium]|jgi:drug/metabolite transporter (DMT)-like permease|nr:DMT family transporter [Deltaproteobacteria bacterium]